MIKLNESKLIEYLEGELSPEEEKLVESAIERDPAIGENLRALRSTYLDPRDEEPFPGKEMLKKSGSHTIPLRWVYTGIAATILLALLIFSRRELIFSPFEKQSSAQNEKQEIIVPGNKNNISSPEVMEALSNATERNRNETDKDEPSISGTITKKEQAPSEVTVHQEHGNPVKLFNAPLRIAVLPEASMTTHGLIAYQIPAGELNIKNEKQENYTTEKEKQEWEKAFSLNLNNIVRAELIKKQRNSGMKNRYYLTIVNEQIRFSGNFSY